MPKLDFAKRTRANIESAACHKCSNSTFAIDQNLCDSGEHYICFNCSALQRTYCCPAYRKRFWPGLMRDEVMEVNAAIQAGDKRRLKRALKNFGSDANDAKIMAEMARYNPESGSLPTCISCGSTAVWKDMRICHPCKYWVDLAAKYDVPISLIRTIFKSWDTRQYDTFSEYMEALAS